MAYALISSVAAAINGNNATTGAIDTTGANLIVVISGAVSATPSITDSKSNSWTDLTVYGSTLTGHISYSSPSSVGSGHTFTANGSGNPCLAVMAFSGSVGSPFDGAENGGNTAAGMSQASGNVTPSTTGCLVVTGLIYNVDPNTVSVTAPFTPATVGIAAVSGLTFGAYFSHEIQTSIVSRNPTWSLSTAPSFMTVPIAVFSSGGSGGGRGLFRISPILGIGIGGSFFRDPLQGRSL